MISILSQPPIAQDVLLRNSCKMVFQALLDTYTIGIGLRIRKRFELQCISRYAAWKVQRSEKRNWMGYLRICLEMRYYKTDSIIQSSLLHELRGDVTVIKVAHRLQNIMDADRILVLDTGNIVEFEGPNKELLKLPKVNCGLLSMNQEPGIIVL